MLYLPASRLNLLFVKPIESNALEKPTSKETQESFLFDALIILFVTNKAAGL